MHYILFSPRSKYIHIVDRSNVSIATTSRITSSTLVTMCTIVRISIFNKCYKSTVSLPLSDDGTPETRFSERGCQTPFVY